MRRWLLVLLLIGAALFAWTSRAELGAVAGAWSGARWTWLAAAILAQAGFQLATAAMYRLSLRVTGVPVGVLPMVPTYLGAMAVNVVAPSGGATGTTWMVDRIYRRGGDPGRATAGLILARALSFSSFLVVFVAALWMLPGVLAAAPASGEGLVGLGAWEGGVWTGALAVALVAGGHLGLLFLAARRPALLEALLARLELWQGRWRARFRRDASAPDWSEAVSAELKDAAAAVWASPVAVWLALALALVAYACDLACLRAVFAAFDVPIAWDVMVVGYALGTLFWVVPITPQGIGLVEGTMAVAYVGLGVPGAAATAVALAFRGVNFWLPLAVGVGALRGISSQETG
jgi:uncharacterized membrane protein YbhN (UPF0104 family)